ncbi:MAG: sigma-54-dependent Fis family transcriptional regulator, partial [Proteobacteria bacterium]|nr:sigma-54-dependent Fis family transcriptional regulator [Pseudomonadota bacterium]
MNATILLAEDDASLRFVLSQALSKEGYTVRATASASALSKWVRDGEGSLVLSDVYIGDDNIFEALPRMRAVRPDLPIIVMSAQSTVATALSATTAGAYEYIPKPFDLDELLATVRRALDGGPDAKTRAQSSKAQKEEKLPLIGRSTAMQDVYRTMARVSGTNLTVLIEGESGTGKERVARALHDHSRRASDVRLIVSSQRNLASLVRQGLFRQDLFYRLNVVSIRLPPLRERLEDVDDIARAFLVRVRREGLPEKALDNAAIEKLKAHSYPGNVRELENLLRRAAALSPAPVITAGEIHRELNAAAVSQPGEFLPNDDDFEAAVSRRLEDEFSA